MAVSARAEPIPAAAPASDADGGSLITAATLIGPATLLPYRHLQPLPTWKPYVHVYQYVYAVRLQLHKGLFGLS
jgi:hypothetical protein